MPSTLFPDEIAEPPSPLPTDPVFWVRRVVLLEDRTSAERVIRDIPFRRGLNVVRVIDRPQGQVGNVGHSVGKTLLTRFIRYCLGERYYATDEVTAQVAQIHPNGYVVAEVVIGSVGWVVARPFAVGGDLKSHAWRSDQWAVALDAGRSSEPFEEYAEALSQAAVGQWPALRLPGAKRDATWLDLLGWLSRDQDCNFTHYNDWRSQDARSGSKRHTRDDASLIAAWGLGLIDTTEAEGRTAHQKLLADREKAERALRTEDAVQTASRRVLGDRFPDLSQETDNTIFTVTAAKQAGEKVEQLRGLLKEIEVAKPLMEMKKTAADLRKKQSEESGLLERLKGQVQAKEGQIQNEEAAKDELKCHCPGKPSGCPVNLGKRVGADPTQSTAAVARLNRELTDLRTRQSEAQAVLDSVSAELGTAETAYDTADAKHRDNLRKLGEDIGRWQAHSEEVKAYSDSTTRSEKAQRRVKRLNAEIEKSERQLRERRDARTKLIRLLSTAYGQVLTQLLGQETAAELEFDGKGVHPKPGPTLRANGLGMATLATVIGFDLVALRVAVEGLSPLPRFFIHDSPKASDLESALYHLVFGPLLSLDAMSPDPAFQYIITTTTPPPDEASGEPYVRLVLDARTAEGRLLKVEF